MPDGITISAEDLRGAISTALGQFLGEQAMIMTEISADLEPLLASVAELVSGGKRLRPSFCLWAYLGCGGTDIDAAVKVGAALELVQACALIHDDVMDASDTRRGKPAAHRWFATVHRSNGWLGSSDRFGDGAAILAGDLCLSWADELLVNSGFDGEALGRARVPYDLMRTELMCGQYLDLLEQARGGGSVPRALRVVKYKSAKYTIERPLHIGAALAGADVTIMDGLSAYGLPLGEAFQLRDDLLGVFGDPAETGKPAGDDLREGKRTLLVASAVQRGTPAQVDVLRAGLGDAHLGQSGIDDLREVLADTGARAHVESVIAADVALAGSALAKLDVTPAARVALGELLIAATARSL